jgi:hypothetical protein
MEGTNAKKVLQKNGSQSTISSTLQRFNTNTNISSQSTKQKKQEEGLDGLPDEAELIKESQYEKAD